MAAEMAVIRLTHVADLPTPEDLLRKLQEGEAPVPAGSNAPMPSPGGGVSAQMAQPVGSGRGGISAALARKPVPLAQYTRFEDVVALIQAHRDTLLEIDIETHLRLVSYSPGKITFEPGPGAPADLAQKLAQRLQSWTGLRWGVTVVRDGGAPTIAESRQATEARLKAEAMDHPLVAAVFAQFPNARITNLRSKAQLQQEAALDALAEVQDEWDPFEEN